MMLAKILPILGSGSLELDAACVEWGGGHGGELFVESPVARAASCCMLNSPPGNYDEYVICLD